MYYKIMVKMKKEEIIGLEFKPSDQQHLNYKVLHLDISNLIHRKDASLV